MEIESETFLTLVSKCFDNVDTLTENEIKTLVKGLDYAYHFLGKSLVPDIIFDTLLKNAREKYSDVVLYSEQSLNKVITPVEMPSLKKIYNTEEDKLARKCKDLNTVLLSSKLDGVSCLLDKKRNKIQLFTKGTGTKGKNISHLQKYIKIDFDSLPDKCTIRGELIMKKSTNPGAKALRSQVIGFVNMLPETIIDDDLANLEMICYEVIKPQNLNFKQQFDFLHEKGIKTPCNRVCLASELTRNNLEAVYKEFAEREEYEIDGVVVSETSLTFDNSSRDTFSFAFKHNTLYAKTWVRAIEWAESRKSLAIPIIVFKPVILNNSIIERATGHNAQYVINNRIGIGAEIEITLSGNSISKIERVITPSDNIILPENGEMSGVHFKMHLESVVTIAKRIEKYFEVFEINGIKAKSIITVISCLNDAGLIIPDIFTFVREIKNWQVNRSGTSILGPVKDKNLYDAVNKLTSKRVYFKTICVACGLFDSFGITKTVSVLSQCPSILEYIQSLNNDEDAMETDDTEEEEDDMETDTVEVAPSNKLFEIKKKLLSINGIGAASTTAFIEGLNAFIDKKEDFDNTFNIDYGTTQEMKQKRIRICFTNVKQTDKYLQMYSDMIIMQNSVTKETEYVVVPDQKTCSGKVTKAKQYKIKIITLLEFHNLMTSMSIV